MVIKIDSDSDLSFGGTQSPPDKVSPRDGAIYVVVRAFNEAQVIGPVLAGLKTAFSSILVVDDGSSDGTAAVAVAEGVAVVRHCVNLGAGAALQTGIDCCLANGARWIVNFDADGQHRVEDAVRLADTLLDGGCDVVIGSRFLGDTLNMPTHRRVVLKLAVLFSRLIDRSPLTDAHNGLRGFTRRAAEVLCITQSGMAYASEMIHQLVKARMLIKEVPVTIEYTDYSLKKGQSSLNAVNILLDLAIGRFLK